MAEGALFHFVVVELGAADVFSRFDPQSRRRVGMKARWKGSPNTFRPAGGASRSCDGWIAGKAA